jgi:CIC family chloride channel protein
MRTHLVAFPASASVGEVHSLVHDKPTPRGQHLYPVLDVVGGLKGVITRKQVQRLAGSEASRALLGDIASRAVVAYPDEPLRLVVMRMAGSGLTRLPVVETEDGLQKLVGMISLEDLLKARIRNLADERHRERVLHLKFGVGQALPNTAT